MLTFVKYFLILIYSGIFELFEESGLSRFSDLQLSIPLNCAFHFFSWRVLEASCCLIVSMGWNEVVKAADEVLPQLNLTIRTKLRSSAKLSPAVASGRIRETSLAIDRHGRNGAYAPCTLQVAIRSTTLAPWIHLWHKKYWYKNFLNEMPRRRVTYLLTYSSLLLIWDLSSWLVATIPPIFLDKARWKLICLSSNKVFWRWILFTIYATPPIVTFEA